MESLPEDEPLACLRSQCSHFYPGHGPRVWRDRRNMRGHWQASRFGNSLLHGSHAATVAVPVCGKVHVLSQHAALSHMHYDDVSRRRFGLEAIRWTGVTDGH